MTPHRNRKIFSLSHTVAALVVVGLVGYGLWLSMHEANPSLGELKWPAVVCLVFLTFALLVAHTCFKSECDGADMAEGEIAHRDTWREHSDYLMEVQLVASNKKLNELLAELVPLVQTYHCLPVSSLQHNQMLGLFTGFRETLHWTLFGVDRVPAADPFKNMMTAGRTLRDQLILEIKAHAEELARASGELLRSSH